jgi:ATP-dependent protease ClpP protease subunit
MECFTITNKANKAEVLIYEDISASSSGAFVRALRDVKADEITVRINSSGGNVFDAIAMTNALRDHPARVTTIVDGLAASAASFIATAGDEVVMNRNSELMIHNPKAMGAGGAQDMRSLADRLDAVRDNIASMYVARAGGTVEQWREVMAAETWYSADEAVQAGLADRVSEQPAVTNSHDLSAFHYAGRSHAPDPLMFQPINHIDSAPVETPQREDGIMPTLNEGLAALFGVPADADDETILTAARERLDAAVDTPEPVEPVEPTIEQAAAIAAKSGLTLVNSETLVALQEQARAGAEARALQVRQAHELVVENAINEGRIAPSSRDHWMTQLAADPEGIKNVIDSLPAVIPVTEVGHSISNEADDENALYSMLFGATVKDGATNV